MNSVLDFATPCVYRKFHPGVPEGTYQCSKWIRGRVQGGDLSRVHLDNASWSHGVGFSSWSLWTILFTHGACKGQYRTLTRYSSSPHGGTATLSSPLSEVPGQVADVFDASKTSSFEGCFAPDTSSEYVLFSSSSAPGSISGSVFAVRWAGLIRASLASSYTFHTSLSGDASSHERLKLWIDGQLLIDQWSSLDSLSMVSLAPSTFKKNERGARGGEDNEVLYHVQVDYKRGKSTGLPARMRLEWNNLDIHGYTAAGDLPATKHLEPHHLYTALPIPTTEYLSLEPGSTCASLSEVHGAGLTAATAGIAAAFLVTARDAFSNLRELHEDSWLAFLESPDASDPLVRPSISPTPVPGKPWLKLSIMPMAACRRGRRGRAPRTR